MTRSARSGCWTALAAIACALGIAGAATAAHAQACGRPDLLDAVPPDGATGVPPNASLFAHYDIAAEYLGEDVVLGEASGGEEIVAVTFDATQGLLTYAPAAPLRAGSTYTIRWPALRGLGAAAAGRGANVTFTVGAGLDTEAPQFDGVTGLQWDLERPYSDCAKAQEERIVFDLELAPASDDGGRAGLTLLVFQTAGPAAGTGSVPVLVRAMPPPGGRARVALPPGDTVGRTCMAALARDLTGKISDGGSQELCVDVTAPPFFYGCAIAAATDGTSPGGGTLAVVGLSFSLALRLARARRSQRTARPRRTARRTVSGVP